MLECERNSRNSQKGHGLIARLEGSYFPKGPEEKSPLLRQGLKIKDRREVVNVLWGVLF